MVNAFGVSIESIKDDEVRFHFMMCLFLNDLTNSQMQTFSELLLIVLNRKDENLNIFNETKPTTSVHDFRQHCFQGKNARPGSRKAK